MLKKVITITSIIFICSSAWSNINSDLFKAIEIGDLEKVDILIDKGANVNVIKLIGDFEETPLHIAVQYGQVEIAKLLIENGANINIKQKEDGESLLHYAVREGNIEIIRLLIDSDSDINVIDDEINSPLHIAIILNNVEIIKLLVENEADINIRNKNGKTPLDCSKDKIINDILRNAMGKTSEELLKIDINEKDIDQIEDNELVNEENLYEAINKGNLDKVKSLIENGVDINTTNGPDNWTPLHFAVSNNEKDIVKLLIEKGANINIKDNYGKTPLELTENEDIKKIFISNKEKK